MDMYSQQGHNSQVVATQDVVRLPCGLTQMLHLLTHVYAVLQLLLREVTMQNVILFLLSVSYTPHNS